MSIAIETIKASQLAELTEVTDSNYVVVTDGDTSKKIKATNLKGDLSNINSAVNLNSKKINELNSQMDTIIQQRGYVTYEDFGAKGDGVSDDGEYIRQAHLKANELNKQIFCPIPKKYYIKEIENIPISTNVDWNNSEIIIDDNTTLTKPIFIVKDTSPTLTLNRDDCASLVNISKSTDKIELLSGYGDIFVELINEDKKIFIREGANADSGSNLSDMTIIDNNGVLKYPLEWDFEKITQIKISPLPDNYLTIKNGIFKTVSDSYNSNAYINRGININRNNTIIKNITHNIIQDKENIGRCYNGFLYVHNCSNIKIIDTKLSPRYFKYVNKVASGTYDIGVYNCLNLLIDNMEAFSTTKEHWGVWGGNFIKNLDVRNSKLNRIDAHKGVFNVSISNSCIGDKGLTLCGGGKLVIKDCDIYASNLITFRGDFGATWLGDIYIDNIRHYTLSNKPSILNCSYNVSHNYGYDCDLGKNIISIRNYMTYCNGYDVDNVSIINTDLYKKSEEILSFYHLANNIELYNLKTDMNDIGYIVIKGFNGRLLKAHNEGLLIKSEPIYDEYEVNIIPNVIINIESMQTSTRTIKYETTCLINYKDKYGNVATDDYGTNSLDLLIKFNINNCDKLTASVYGLPCILNINNSNICMLLNKNGGSRSKTIINNCEVIPLTTTLQVCIRVNSRENSINNTIFSNPNNLIVDTTSLKGIYDIFNINDDKAYQNLANLKNCKFDNTLNITKISNVILDIAPNFPNGEANKYEFYKKGSTSLRKELSSYGYLQGILKEFYDTDLRKMLYKIDSSWYDSMGNKVD